MYFFFILFCEYVFLFCEYVCNKFNFLREFWMYFKILVKNKVDVYLE